MLSASDVPWRKPSRRAVAAIECPGLVGWPDSRSLLLEVASVNALTGFEGHRLKKSSRSGLFRAEAPFALNCLMRHQARAERNRGVTPLGNKSNRAALQTRPGQSHAHCDRVLLRPKTPSGRSRGLLFFCKHFGCVKPRMDMGRRVLPFHCFKAPLMMFVVQNSQSGQRSHPGKTRQYPRDSFPSLAGRSRGLVQEKMKKMKADRKRAPRNPQ